MSKFSARSLNNLTGVHPKLRKVLEAAIEETPVDFTITEGVRTVDRQRELYAQGRTKPGAIVTNADGVTKKSNHQPKSDGYGHAVDLYPYAEGSVQVAHPKTVEWLTQIADHIKSVARSQGVTVEWGGDWTRLRDYPHFELK